MRHRAALGPDIVDRVLDDVERRRFLVEPAREDAPPARIAPLDVELDEGAGQRLGLPRRARLAGAQPHHDVADADRLPRLHRQIALEPVALVEQADDRDTIRHRRFGAAERIGLWSVRRLGFGLGRRGTRRVAARAERQRGRLAVGFLQRLDALPRADPADQRDSGRKEQPLHGLPGAAAAWLPAAAPLVSPPE